MLLYLHFLHQVKDLCGLKVFSVSNSHPEPKERIFTLYKNLGKKSPLSDGELEELFSISDDLSEILAERLKYVGEDILTFYGSIYLPSYISKKKVDRVDF